jgi:glycosyltransferase involved in cell wall biosynthesis
MAPSVGLVVPAYSPDVDRLSEYVEQLDDILSPATIRIELDAAEDGVAEELAGLPVTVNTVPYRRGKGAAITDGFEALTTDVLAFADADGATPAREMKTVIEAVTEREADLAAGSRRHPDATVATHQTRARRYMGDSFAWLARRLLEVDLYDYQCGAKAITSGAWQQVRHHLYESGFAWDVELLAIAGALNLRVEEVPVEWYDRPGSTVSPIRTALDLAQALVTSRHRAKRLSDSRLHTAIADRREEPNALIEQE